MDFEKRSALLQKIGDLKDTTNTDVYVSLEAFFDGNDDLGCFWCNLGNPPHSMTEAYDFLTAIRERPDVQDVKIRITQIDDDDQWLFSDTVVVFTDKSPEEVQRWLERFPPDEAGVEDDGATVAALGGRFVWLWWD